MKTLLKLIIIFLFPILQYCSIGQPGSNNISLMTLRLYIENLRSKSIIVSGKAQLVGAIKSAKVEVRTVSLTGTDAGKCDGISGAAIGIGTTSSGDSNKNNGGDYNIQIEKPENNLVCIVVSSTPISTAYSPFQNKIISWKNSDTSSSASQATARIASIVALDSSNTTQGKVFRANVNPFSNMAIGKLSSSLTSRSQIVSSRVKSNIYSEPKFQTLDTSTISKKITEANESIGEIFFGRKVNLSTANFTDSNSPGYDSNLFKQSNAVLGGIDTVVNGIIETKGIKDSSDPQISVIYNTYFGLIKEDIAGDGSLDGKNFVDDSGNAITPSADYANVINKPLISISAGMKSYVTMMVNAGIDDGSGIAWTDSDISNPNLTGSALTTFSSLPTISYTTSIFTFTQNLPVTITPTVTGSITSCAASPTLPNGLSIDTSTCAISGTPTTIQSATNYTITVSNSFGSVATTISITINTNPPSSLSYTGSPFTFTQNTPITIITPTVIGTITSCAVNPTLPNGLNIDTSTCAISGTPTTIQSATNYTITASNSFGSVATTISIAINANAPSGLAYTGSPFTFTQNTPIATITPTFSGTITGCYSIPSLPSGLSLSNSCVISGTPTNSQSSTSYTITPSNSNGDGTTATINIAINISAPSGLTYSGTPYTFTQNATISNITPTYSGIITSCASSPTLPSGLSLSNSCVISGTPSSLQSAANYVITPSNSTGTGASATISISVNNAPPSGLAYPGTPFTFTQNVVISNQTPTYSGTITGCASSPTLPSGLALSNSCVISGAPTTIQGATNYTITPSNSNGNGATATISIAVIDVIPTVAISVLRNNSIVESGFVIGTASDNNSVSLVQVSIDGGAYSSATGTTSWKFQLPSGASAWKSHSSHTIAVRSQDNASNYSNITTITVRKGNNKDVNGDGYPDLVTSAFGYNSSAGRVYIFNSSSSGISSAGAASANTILTGNAANDQFGASWVLGDINGDGYADLLIGAPGYSTQAGRAYIFHSAGTSGIASAGAASANTTITGSAAGAVFGISVALGDINSDGYADAVIGAAYYSTFTGRAHIFHSSASGITATTSNTATKIITGVSTEDRFGISVAVGDINGDGYADVIVGANQFNSILKGITYVFHATASGITVTGAASANKIINGKVNGDIFGDKLALGDINGDGYLDLIVGAYGYSSYAGGTFIFHSSATGFTVTSANSANTIITGSGQEEVGLSVESGDLNGDGYADIITGASTFFGHSYIFYSTGSSGISTAAASAANSIFVGDVTGDKLGSRNSILDINGDGYLDAIMGAAGVSANTGKAYIFYSSSTGVSSASAGTANSILTGETTTNYFR